MPAIALAATVAGEARNTCDSLSPMRPGKLRFVALGVDDQSPASAQFGPDENLLAWGNRDGDVTVCDLRAIAAKLKDLGDMSGAAKLLK